MGGYNWWACLFNSPELKAQRFSIIGCCPLYFAYAFVCLNVKNIKFWVNSGATLVPKNGYNNMQSTYLYIHGYKNDNFQKSTGPISPILSWHKFPLAQSFLIFVWGLLSHSVIFHSYGDVTITDEGLQILTYARHSWPLSSEGSLACHTYCDTGHPFKMVISEDLWHSHLLSSV